MQRSQNPVLIRCASALVLSFLLGGCQQVIRMEPLEFRAETLDGETQIVALDPEVLFKDGKRAFRSQQFASAARLFEVFLREYPDHSLARNALYNAGLAHEKNEGFEQAVEHFKVYLENSLSDADRVDVLFRLAFCYRGLGNWEELGAMAVALRKMELSTLDKAETHALEGVSWEGKGELAKAERAYLKALGFEDKEQDPELFQRNEQLAMAQYQIGEIYRSLFLSIPFRLPVERMKRDLHDKSTLFLKAQSAYLRAIRRQNKTWALAAGFRTGEMYEVFYQDFIGAEVPKELDDEDTRIYFDELRAQVRPLLERAIRVYERNIKLGERSRQGHSPWVEKTRNHLTNLKSLLEADLERERLEKEEGRDDETPRS